MQPLASLRQGLARLIRPRRPETGPIRLGRRRIYILPTWAGLLYALTLVAMLLGAINYDLALGHALVFLLVSLGLVGMLHAHKNLLGLEISAQGREAVHAGELAHFRLQVQNPGPSPRPGLEWSASPRQPMQLQHLPGNDTGHLDLALEAPRRGWLELPPLKLASRYPLGLFLAWAHSWPAARCLVYPKPRFTPLPPGRQSGHSGAYPGREGQEDFAGFRERQPADSPRHVAWKAAARDAGDKPLLVKTFSGGAREELWLEWEDTSGDTEERLSILAGWVMDAEGAGLDYGLRLPRQALAPDHGTAHRQRCLQALALYPGATP